MIRFKIDHAIHDNWIWSDRELTIDGMNQLGNQLIEMVFVNKC